MKPLLSRPIRVARLARERTEEVVADQKERDAIAADLKLIALEKLEARLTVRPWRGEGVLVEGTVCGTLSQECVVSLEPMTQTVEDTIARRFHPDVRESAQVELDPEADDPPEPLDGDVVDLGAIALEQFILGIDPYPRAPGVTFDGPEEADVEADEPSPFAVLAKLAPGATNGSER